jgi:putative intracellular protease/amidase
MSSKKVLVVLTSSDKITLQKKTVKSGNFISELIIPVQMLRNEGWNIIYANPIGQTPPIDPLSKSSVWFGFSKKKFLKAKNDLEKEMEAGLKNPRTLSSFNDDELESFDGIFVPGGHAPMEDLGGNSDLGRILLHFHKNNKPTGVICHGPVALLSTKKVEDGAPWSYQEYKMTCYSNLEELANQIIWTSKLKFKLEEALKFSGCKVTNRLPLLPNVVVDRELISGQGPTSVTRFGKTFVEKLNNYYNLKKDTKNIESNQKTGIKIEG